MGESPTDQIDHLVKRELFVIRQGLEVIATVAGSTDPSHDISNQLGEIAARASRLQDQLRPETDFRIGVANAQQQRAQNGG